MLISFSYVTDGAGALIVETEGRRQLAEGSWQKSVGIW